MLGNHSNKPGTRGSVISSDSRALFLRGSDMELRSMTREYRSTDFKQGLSSHVDFALTSKSQTVAHQLSNFVFDLCSAV